MSYGATFNVRRSSADFLTSDEALVWRRDHPVLHDLVAGRLVRLPGTKQAELREVPATLAAAVWMVASHLTASRRWVARPKDEFGAVPLGVAAKDCSGLTQLLRLPEAIWPGCTAAGYPPSAPATPWNCSTPQ